MSFPWLKLVGLALQLAIWFISWAERRKAVSEGEANAIRISVEKADDLVTIVQRARDSVTNDKPSVLDEFDRDNDPKN